MTCEIYCFLVAQSITVDNNWIAWVALSPSSVRLFKQADIRQYLYDINIHYLHSHLSEYAGGHLFPPDVPAVLQLHPKKIKVHRVY